MFTLHPFLLGVATMAAGALESGLPILIPMFSADIRILSISSSVLISFFVLFGSVSTSILLQTCVTTCPLISFCMLSVCFLTRSTSFLFLTSNLRFLAAGASVNLYYLRLWIL